MRSAGRYLRFWACAGAAVLAVPMLSACQVGQIGVRTSQPGPQSTAHITVTPAAKAGASVSPGSPVVVSVVDGRLTDVTVSGPTGPLAGTLSPDGRTWTSDGTELEFGATYSVKARALDRMGVATDLTDQLQTLLPTRFLGATISPREGAVVGIGMPVLVRFDHDVTKGSRAAVEKRMSVDVDGAPLAGGWRWLSSTLAEYRPEVYWPGHSTVAVHLHLKGLQVGQAWGQKNITRTFSTAAAMISYVDMNTDQMKVTRDGRTIKTIPVTTGKAGFESRSGVKVIMDKEPTRLMDAATGGTLPTDPEYYRLTVQWAMRLTNSGEFLHAAPWSVAHQGHTNVSHGCTGMSTANALWLYDNSHIGDVVVYSAGHTVMEPGNGWGLWNISWSHWQSYSALS